MLSLPGSDEGNEKHQVAFDAWGRQETVPHAAERNGSTDIMSFSVYFITGSPLSQSLSWSLSTSPSLNTAKGWMLVRLEWHFTTTTGKCERTSCGDHADEHLALNLPRFGNGRQVTSGHHHGPRNTTHDQYHLCNISLYTACVCVCLCLHDYLFASGLQHHVLGPVVPVLVGLGLVHNLLKHCSLPAQNENKDPIVYRCVCSCISPLKDCRRCF